ncbi:MAG: hypothetical protein KAR18_01330, partial [Spirochaetes bacterium]|nr:hypothetical protein [Spirochaetota bacterium]
KDAGNNDAVIVLPATTIATGSAIVVDTAAPVISSITSSTGDGVYDIGTNINVTVTFNEPVTLNAAAVLEVTLDTGDVVNIVGPAGPGTTFSGTYTVGAADSSPDLDSTAVNLSSGSIIDAAGNTAVIALPAVTIADGSAIVINTTVPVITGAVVDSSNRWVDVTFSKSVYGTAGGTGALDTGDFNLIFSKNSGYAAGVIITNITRDDNSALSGGENVIRIHLNVTGIPVGDETIEIKPVTNLIFSLGGIPAADTDTTGLLNLNQEIVPIEEGEVIIRNNMINPGQGEYTIITFKLKKSAKVKVTVYDLAGNPVKVLYNRKAPAGVTNVRWYGKNKKGRKVIQGVYYVVTMIGKKRHVKKVLIVR